jgi:sensor c-di-GMP phosphodiesterase-like protein
LTASEEPLTVAIIAIANALGVDVIAEGVETQMQRDFLVRNGCRDGQGFLYAKALPPSTIAEILVCVDKSDGFAVEEACRRINA